ncbi:hypothetical protein HYH03_014625 [Edaphochlamys debaryana]|uniref:Uncharacterized protein n=1 Tax=Edaphochlamys debaryana TaxID=47281 RepID=A0A835XR28_9CHLO|nr:hypothetical protein HYH03_014625 [Edaphochlamys debaryana]|eukprot:KAG2486696.1 hypothetical protein HYH03_014625 [Edaphochlamys debaryana]
MADAGGFGPGSGGSGGGAGGDRSAQAVLAAWEGEGDLGDDEGHLPLDPGDLLLPIHEPMAVDLIAAAAPAAAEVPGPVIPALLPPPPPPHALQVGAMSGPGAAIPALAASGEGAAAAALLAPVLGSGGAGGGGGSSSAALLMAAAAAVGVTQGQGLHPGGPAEAVSGGQAAAARRAQPTADAAAARRRALVEQLGGPGCACRLLQPPLARLPAVRTSPSSVQRRRLATAGGNSGSGSSGAEEGVVTLAPDAMPLDQLAADLEAAPWPAPPPLLPPPPPPQSPPQEASLSGGAAAALTAGTPPGGLWGGGGGSSASLLGLAAAAAAAGAGAWTAAGAGAGAGAPAGGGPVGPVPLAAPAGPQGPQSLGQGVSGPDAQAAGAWATAMAVQQFPPACLLPPAAGTHPTELRLAHAMFWEPTFCENVHHRLVHLVRSGETPATVWPRKKPHEVLSQVAYVAKGVTSGNLGPGNRCWPAGTPVLRFVLAAPGDLSYEEQRLEGDPKKGGAGGAAPTGGKGEEDKGGDGGQPEAGSSNPAGAAASEPPAPQAPSRGRRQAAGGGRSSGGKQAGAAVTGGENKEHGGR